MAGKKSSSFPGAMCRRFFGLGPAELKRHPGLVHLNLTEEEIFRNRHDILKVITSRSLCGESRVFCNSLRPHYGLRRNMDNQLLLVEEVCRKRKNHEEMSEEQIMECGRRHMTFSDIRFDPAEVRAVLEHYRNSDDAPEIMRSGRMGDATYVLCNLFSSQGVRNRKRHLIYLFHALLTGTDVMVIKSEHIKRLALDQCFDRRGEELHLLRSARTVPLLIILDFGIENSSGKNYYFMDYVPELLLFRKGRDRVTCIFSPVEFDVICEDLRRNNYYIRNQGGTSAIQEAKMAEFEWTMKEVFSGPKS